MDLILQGADTPDILSQFLIRFEQGLYNACAAGSTVQMPQKLKISGIYMHEANSMFITSVEQTPHQVISEVQIKELAETRETTLTPISETQDVTVAGESTEDTTEDTDQRRSTRTKGSASNSETTTHPTRTNDFRKAGGDRTTVDRTFRFFAYPE